MCLSVGIVSEVSTQPPMQADRPAVVDVRTPQKASINVSQNLGSDVALISQTNIDKYFRVFVLPSSVNSTYFS